MKNRLEVESAILELRDVTTLTTMICNNAEVIDNTEEYASLFSIVDDVLKRKIEKLFAAFYKGSLI
jgi:hypothetical protein